MDKVKIGIIGGAGYTGGELIRLLIHHPKAEIGFIQSKSNANKPVGSVHGDLFHSPLTFSEDYHFDLDVLFLCAGHGEAIKFLQSNVVPSSVKIIDLSNDFRLLANKTMGERTFTYGLPELNKAEIQKAHNIANPGCFATALQLGLLPLAQKGLLGDVYSTGITGATGAGQALSPTSHFPYRLSNVSAYKTLIHQHMGEVKQSLKQHQPHGDFDVKFVPWRGDFARGIFVSSQVKSRLSFEENIALFKSYYENEPFTYVVNEGLHLKQVVNTNYCAIMLEQVGEDLVIHSAIDNLVKGASGQAVHNMNLLFGFEETLGLNLKANLY